MPPRKLICSESSSLYNTYSMNELKRQETAVARTRSNHGRLLKNMLLVITLIGATSCYHIAGEPLPHAVSGVFTIDDDPVQNYLLVEAKINGTLYAATHIKNGRFGYDPYFKIPSDDPSTPSVEGGKDGQTVNLYLDGIEILAFTFESGRITNFVEDISNLYNDPPKAITETNLNGVAGYSVHFDATESNDPNDDSLTCAWVHDDGSSSSDVMTSHIFNQIGGHITTLTVTDHTGHKDSINITVNINQPPDPYSWTRLQVEGGKQTVASTSDNEISIWLTTLNNIYVSIIEYDEPFLYNQLPDRSLQPFAISCDRSSLVYPIYIETEVPEGFSSYTTKLFSWRMGEWKPVPTSGVIKGENKAWAYMDETTLGEGIFLIGLTQEALIPEVMDTTITVDGDTTHITAHLSSEDPRNLIYLRIDDHIAASSYITENEMTFSVENLQPGKHVFEVNGYKKEAMLHSDENIFMIVSLSALPLTLLTVLFRKFV